jgi:phospholipid/cholesterol/gamma-HCH transport system substrate-binding protein
VSLTYQHTRFRYANQAAGVFVILTVIIFGAAFFFSGQVREWLHPGQRIKVILPSDGLFGLSEGSEVEILGTKAGKVLRIVINPDQQMHADVQIQNDMKAFVRRDSSAVIRKRFGVAGDSFLEISRGFGEPLDWEFAVLNASADRAPTESIGKILDEVRSKVFPVIDDTQKAIQAFLTVAKELQDPDKGVQQLLTNINSIADRIDRGQGTIGRLLTEDKLVREMESLMARLDKETRRLGPILGDLQATIQNVAEFSTRFNAQSADIPEITRSLKEALASIERVMEDLSQTTPQLPTIVKNVEDTTDALPVFVLQVQQVMAELEQLIKQLQSHWLMGSKTGEKRPTNTRISPLEVRP